MMNKEEYKKEIVRMWDSLRTINKGKSSCDGVLCGDCPLSLFDGCSSAEDIFDIYKTVEEWSNEHPQTEHIDIVRKMPNERPQKKHKISQLEYDILKYNYYINATSRFFFDDKFLMSLLKEGYFKGADERDVVNCYFLDCEVDNDYE